ncbi:MAG: hypothetical protein CMM91_04690 [Rickettsiales bacterium]|nr:hypothetical protein [Rickettsiales bacterium]OUV53764.1 MAG: hypothetical protein CBC87_03435 [Rickettsiales bacterium TMED127]
MAKLDGTSHQKFFNLFIKITIISCILLTIILALLYFYLVV